MYKIRMTQNEIDAYWLVLRNVYCSYYYMDIYTRLTIMKKYFRAYTTLIHPFDQNVIDSYVHETSSSAIEIKDIDPLCVKRCIGDRPLLSPNPNPNTQTMSERTFIVTLDDFDISILNLVSSVVGGEHPYRVMWNTGAGCSSIIKTLWGYSDFIDNGRITGGFRGS